jgi:hypothetical protein
VEVSIEILNTTLRKNDTNYLSNVNKTITLPNIMKSSRDNESKLNDYLESRVKEIMGKTLGDNEKSLKSIKKHLRKAENRVLSLNKKQKEYFPK